MQASTKVSHARSCARTRWNLRFGFVSEDMDLSIVVFGENIFDEEGDVLISAGNGEPTFKSANCPHTIGVEFTKCCGRP